MDLVFNLELIIEVNYVIQRKIVYNILLNKIKKIKKMQIFIKLFDQKTITVDVESTFTIKMIKELIKDKEDISIEEQTLIFQGIILDDKKTLANYKILSESTINLIKSKLEATGMNKTTLFIYACLILIILYNLISRFNK